MTLDEFVAKYLNTQVEVAGSSEAVYQCVDLANLYIRDILHLPIIEWTDAKDFPTKAGSNYEYIKNTPEGCPIKGDIIIWNGLTGSGHGHIAICLSATNTKFTSFDQNWSKPLYCTVENHIYTNNKGQVIVDGWLRPKVITAPDTFLGKSKEYWLQVEADRESLLKTEGELKSQVHDLGIQLDASNAQLKHNDKFLQDLAILLSCPKSEGEIIKAINEELSHHDSINKLTTELANAKSEAVQCGKKADELQDLVSTTSTKLVDTENTLKHLTTANRELQDKYDEQIKLNQKPTHEFNTWFWIVRLYRKGSENE